MQSTSHKANISKLRSQITQQIWHAAVETLDKLPRLVLTHERILINDMPVKLNAMDQDKKIIISDMYFTIHSANSQVFYFSVQKDPMYSATYQRKFHTKQTIWFYFGQICSICVKFTFNSNL